MILLSFLLPAIVAASVLPWSIGQPVLTTSGTAKGFKSGYGTDVSEYRGIRFAQATNGTNRFMAPKRYNSTDKFDATSFVSLLYALHRQYD